MNKYYCTIENNKITGKGQCPCSGENITCLEISKEVYDNLEKYIYVDNELILDPDYEEKQRQKQIEQFKKDFFETSLGWVSRAVHMKNGTVRDFLFDIKPNLVVGFPIITYNLDGSQNRGVKVTEQFLLECAEQINKDFYGA